MSRNWRERQENNSLIDGLQGTEGKRLGLAISAKKIISRKTEQTAVPRNRKLQEFPSEPFHHSEEDKNARNSIPLNRNTSKLLKICSILQHALYQERAVFGKMKMNPAKWAQTQNAGEVSWLQWFFSQSIELMMDKVWLHCIRPMLLK